MTSSKRPSDGKKILCIGMPVRDLIYHIKELPGRGEKVRAEQFDEIAGGNGLNASIGIVRLGGRALFSGPMGDASETSSEYIFAQLAKEGIDSNVVRMRRRRDAGVQCDDRSVRRTHDRHLPRSKTLERDAARQQRAAAGLRGGARRKPLRRLCDRVVRRSEQTENSGRARRRCGDVDARRTADDRLAHHLLNRSTHGNGRHGQSRGGFAAARRAHAVVPRGDARRPGHDVARRRRAHRR